eukprot:6455896-Amphidinium_carterae.1
MTAVQMKRKLEETTSQQLAPEDQEEELPYILVDKLQDAGINAADLKKLKDSGFQTGQSIIFAMKKELLNIKGLSDQK